MRLVRHLTFSNAIALIALFIALGGAAYAGSKLNGKSIVNGSIGGGKLKNETITADKIKKGTITSAQIAPGSINSTTIDVSTLPTVPSAQTATTATTAKSATTAETATKADSAVTATTAGDAGTLEGTTVTQLTVHCSGTTEFYGGMCWDKTTRPTKLWLIADEECGDAGGRLPLIGELIAFVLRPGEQVGEQVWSGDVVDVSGAEEKVLTSDENGREKVATGMHGFRCVFPLTN
jgi:hypothetical protein